MEKIQRNDLLTLCAAGDDVKRKKLISWIPADLFSSIRYANDTEIAPPCILKFIITEYFLQSAPAILPDCDKAASALNKQDLHTALGQLYKLWMEEDAPAKRKALLLPYCIYGADAQITVLSRQLDKWARAFRGELAGYAIHALALSNSPSAMVIIDRIANSAERKKPRAAFARLEKAAAEAFSAAAKRLCIPLDVLSDRVVPMLGFDQRGEQTIDYGARTFTVSLMPDLSLSVTNEKGKTMKSLPKPAGSDDQGKAEAAREVFSGLKKQIKDVIQTQSERLERVMKNGRKWTKNDWEALFLDNPIMHLFAAHLIWGVYEGETITATFRYLDDGTLTTVQEEPYILPDDAMITLVHPVEMNAALLDAWKQHFSDYEVEQPLPQLTRPAPVLTEQMLSGNTVIRYKGKTGSVSKLMTAAKKHGFVVDMDSSCASFSGMDDQLGIGMCLLTDFIPFQYYGDVALDNLTFCDKEEQSLDPRTLPARYISCTLATFDNVLVNGLGTEK